MSFFLSLLNAMPGAITQGMLWGIMAIGVYITYRILDVADLTVDGSLATGGAVCVMLMRAGLLHTRCGIPAILAGILTQLALYSVNLRIMTGKANQPIGVDKYDLLVSQRYVRDLALNNPIPLVILFLAVLIGLLYWFFGTEYGSSLRATGANQNMARAQGIDTKSGITFGLMLANGLVAMAGGLLAQYQGAVDVNMGRGAIVIGLAAVIIGEVLLGRVFRNFALKLVSVVIGAVIYYVVIQIVLQLGLNTNDLKLLTALVVALFLAVPYWKTIVLPKKKEV